MDARLQNNLEGKTGNYILPFFWQHGEPEAVLRKYMKAIYDCNIRAVCVESRPHPDFAGEGWWKDMDIILDEARKRGMKVWILDDSHFPTGYCNGALENGPRSLLRRHITCGLIAEIQSGETICVDPAQYKNAAGFVPTETELRKGAAQWPHYEDDRILGFFAVLKGGKDRREIVRIKPQEGRLVWTAPDGQWKICVCHVTGNRGPHRNYMNMLDRQSCHTLIEAVYEPHYTHYKADFGITIAGFFSDEPELGNDHLYAMGKRMEETDDLPWSTELEDLLREKWGSGFAAYLPLLWEKDYADAEKAAIRYEYMDAVTRLVERNFSWQIGNWCRSHGVEYIGHLIEDNNQHSRTGCSLGHYFRGLRGQDMAGIDDIGGQVFPQMEDVYISNPKGTDRDGEFYHYVLGKLASSAAAIEPLKKGRAMCEIFGAYGWGEGVRLEKYLADHFMVRGINRFVPHAFSPAPFPDPDCPPHFYAHGNHPQYRHFGCLMQYMNRICELTDGGRHIALAAILYHGEAEWAGKCMFVQKPAHLLADRQIDYDIIPADVFAEPGRYHTLAEERLAIGTQEYHVFLIPWMQFIPAKAAIAAIKLHQSGFPVLFIDGLPEGILGGPQKILDELRQCQVVPLQELIHELDSLGIVDIRIRPENNRIRCLHYVGDSHLFYFVNEGANPYQGTVKVPVKGSACRYDAWKNELLFVSQREQPDGTELELAMDPGESFLVLFGAVEEACRGKQEVYEGLSLIELAGPWKRSLCCAGDYPDFIGEKEICLPDRLDEEEPSFSGFIRYEKEICIQKKGPVYLEITGAEEGVEVFVNERSAGIQIIPTYRYELTDLIQEGENRIAIEMATTLARSVGTPEDRSCRPKIPIETKIGICGEVILRI